MEKTFIERLEDDLILLNTQISGRFDYFKKLYESGEISKEELAHCMDGAYRKHMTILRIIEQNKKEKTD